MELSLLIPADRVQEIDDKLTAWAAVDRSNNPCFNPNQSAYWHLSVAIHTDRPQRLVVTGERNALAADGLRDMLREFPLCESSFAYGTSESRLLPWETMTERMGRATVEDLPWIMEILRKHVPEWDDYQQMLFSRTDMADAALKALKHLLPYRWKTICDTAKAQTSLDRLMVHLLTP